LRYMVLKDDEGGYILRTYSQIAAAPVALYGQYQTKAHRLTTAAKPAVPRGFLPALREAVTPALWKPLLFSGLAIAALSLFPAFRSGLESWAPKWVLASLPYVKAAVFGILTASVSRSVRSVIERLSQRNSWSRPMTTVLGLGASVLIWAIGGSFLLNAVGVSWASLGASLSISTILFGIAVLDYVNAIFQGALLLTLKPFRIGDQVRIGDHAGAVADITMQHVVLKVDEQSYMLIPHSVVKDSPIRTPREYGQRRN
ncbi:MAG: mechanosensitive ion channel, partial [Elusimicrobia bacterium]|nr:mechanosensitive ion channel [Elusimicrobiota bacterium]